MSKNVERARLDELDREPLRKGQRQPPCVRSAKARATASKGLRYDERTGGADEETTSKA